MAQIPANFQFQIADPRQRPAPAPPVYLKHQVYEDPYVFSKLDHHAMQVASREHASFAALMHDLIYRVNLNELERARVIFRWMTFKNLAALRFETETAGTPEEILTAFKRGRGTFARIFEIMCIYSGVHCVTITGYAKGVDYRPGNKIQGTPFNHSWNAAHVNGAWQLIDAHWATRYLLADRNVTESLVYEYDDFYFLTEPQQLVFSHFPDDPQWQLLARPINVQQYEDLPLTKAQFFKTGMDFLKQCHGTVRTQQGRLQMQLGYWRPNVLFTYKLLNEQLDEVHKGFDLRTFVIQEQAMNTGQLNFYLRVPVAGTYYFAVYATAVEPGFEKQPPVEQVYRASCEYRVIADAGAPDAKPYPACHDSVWGPTLVTPLQYGIVPLTPGGIITTKDGHAEVTFQRVVPDGQNTRLIGKLRRTPQTAAPGSILPGGPAGDDSDLDRCIRQTEMPNNQVRVEVDLPQPAEYGLEFYANDPYRDADTFAHAVQYLVQYNLPTGTTTAEGLRDMYNYEKYAQPLGAIPSPYTNDQFQPGTAQVLPGIEHVPFGGGGHPANPQAAKQPVNSTFRYVPSAGFAPVPQEIAKFSRNIPPVNAAPVSQGRASQLPASSARDSQVAPNSGAGNTGRDSQFGVPDQYGMNAEELAKMPPLEMYHPEQSRANWAPIANSNIEHAPDTFRPTRVAATQRAPKPIPVAAESYQSEMERQVTPIDTFKLFQRVDEHAVQVSRFEHKSFKDLIWALIYARNITDDLEKVRAIFLWLCTKDLHKMNFDNVAKDSPEEILMGIRTGKTTYAQVFEMLCAYAGLHCIIITGYAKGAEYEPGMKFSGRQGQHSWNAVLITGVWRLIDCHWAARRLIGKNATIENIRYELDLFYFLPNPAQLIYTHFPDNSEWQLLQRPLTLAEFEALAPVKSAFFKFGLELATHRLAVINVNQREFELRLSFPTYRIGQLAFTFTLSFANGSEDYRGQKLSRWGMHELQNNQVVFRIRLPTTDPLKLLIYAKEVTESPLVDPSRDTVYGAVCEYRIQAQFNEEPLPAYPPCQSAQFGPNEIARKYDLTPDRREAILRSPNGNVDLRFEIKRPLRFMCKLKTQIPGFDEAALERFVISRSVQDREAKFTIFLPAAGEFGFEIYTNDPTADGNTLFHVWQYLIVAEQASVIGRSLPPLPSGYLGPQLKFAQYGLAPLNYADPYVQFKKNELAIQFGWAQPLRTTAQLFFCPGGAAQPEDVNSFVLQQTSLRENKVTFVARLWRSGFYKLQLFALPYGETSESLPNVFNYLIEVQQSATGAATRAQIQFAKQYAQWKDGCYLHEPLDGRLTPQAYPTGSVPFRIEIPKAAAVAAVVGEEWFQLETHAGDGVWAADVNLAAFWGKADKLSICANYGGQKANYSTLLEFLLS